MRDNLAKGDTKESHDRKKLELSEAKSNPQ